MKATLYSPSPLTGVYHVVFEENDEKRCFSINPNLRYLKKTKFFNSIEEYESQPRNVARPLESFVIDETNELETYKSDNCLDILVWFTHRVMEIHGQNTTTYDCPPRPTMC